MTWVSQRNSSGNSGRIGRSISRETSVSRSEGRPFALQVAARDAAGGERLLLIMDGEGEKVLPGLGLLGRDDRRQHGRFAPGGEHGAVGLTRHAAGFQHEPPPAPVEFFTLNVKHLASSCWFEDAKAAARRRASNSSTARRRGAGRINAPAPGDPAMTRGSRMSCGRRPHAAARSWRGASNAPARFGQRRMPRRSMRVL